MDTIQDYKILYSNLLLKYEELQKEYELKINELKEHLKKYTAPSRNKKYYEKQLIKKLYHKKKLKNIIKKHMKKEN